MAFAVHAQLLTFWLFLKVIPIGAGNRYEGRDFWPAQSILSSLRASQSHSGTFSSVVFPEIANAKHGKSLATSHCV